MPLPVPRSTDTSVESWLAVGRSGIPSRLKSPTAIETGVRPVAKLADGANMSAPNAAGATLKLATEAAARARHAK